MGKPWSYERPLAPEVMLCMLWPGRGCEASVSAEWSYESGKLYSCADVDSKAPQTVIIADYSWLD